VFASFPKVKVVEGDLELCWRRENCTGAGVSEVQGLKNLLLRYRGVSCIPGACPDGPQLGCCGVSPRECVPRVVERDNNTVNRLLPVKGALY
jgi:hypothetical protein